MFSEISKEFWSNTSKRDSDRVILRFGISEDTEAVLIPTIGCQIPFHLLVFPEREVYSFGELPQQEFIQTSQMIEFFRDILKKECGDMILAEHGSIACNRTGPACVFHAHQHLIPLGNKVHELTDLYLTAGGKPDLFTRSAEELREAIQGREYVLLSPFPEVFFVWFNVAAFGSQFVRKAAAQALTGSAQGSDWRSDPFPSRLSFSTEALKRFVQEKFTHEFPTNLAHTSFPETQRDSQFGRLSGKYLIGPEQYLNPHLAFDGVTDVNALLELATAPHHQIPEAAIDQLSMLLKSGTASKSERARIIDFATSVSLTSDDSLVKQAAQDLLRHAKKLRL